MDVPPDILHRAQRGDARAQADVLRAFAPSLRALIRRWGDSADAADQLQDLFAKILRVLPKFRPDGHAQLSTWIFTVAHRTLLEQRRRPQLKLVGLELADHVADSAPGMLAVLEHRSAQQQLENAIRSLPDDQRRVIVLAQIHQQSLEAIAESEGLPLGTVKSRLHRARAQLIAQLGEALDTQNGGARVVT